MREALDSLGPALREAWPSFRKTAKAWAASVVGYRHGKKSKLGQLPSLCGGRNALLTQDHLSPWWLVICGVSTIIVGITSPYILNQVEGEPTPREKERYKATPRRRVAAVIFGGVLLLAGIVRLMA
jgi:hypothetical protein